MQFYLGQEIVIGLSGVLDGVHFNYEKRVYIKSMSMQFDARSGWTEYELVNNLRYPSWNKIITEVDLITIIKSY